MSTPRQYIPFRAVVGRVIAGYRAQHGQQQSSLASRLGMTQANFSRLETGEAILNVEQLSAIAQELQTTPALILDQAERLAAHLEAQGYKVVRARTEAGPDWRPLAKGVLAGLVLTALLKSVE